MKATVPEALAEDAANRTPNQSPRTRIRALHLAFVFEFELPGDSWHRRINVGNPRNPGFLAGPRCSLFRAAHRTLQCGDRKPLAYSRAAIDAFILARLK